MTAAPGEVCGVCAAPLRPAARFCGRCGAQHGRMVPRELGLGRHAERVEPARASAPPMGRGLVVAMLVYVALLVPVLAVLARPALPSIATLVTIYVITGLVGVVGLLALGRHGLATLVPRRWHLADAALASLATGAVLAVTCVIDQVAPPWWVVDRDVLLVDARWSTAETLLCVALLPALAQELAFRGAILTGLRGVLADQSAIPASALLFAIGPLSIPAMLQLTTLGLVLGWTRVRTGSVWPCVLLHAGYKAAVILVSGASAG